jgi:small subunit ribosomal protein S15
MSVTKEKTQELVKNFGKAEKNCGAPEVQVAIWTERINHLTEHLKINKKDFSTRRGLLKLVGKRKRLLGYIKAHRQPDQYRTLLSELNLRK